VTNLNRLFKWLMILSTLIALFVFLFSVLSPFYHISLSGFEYWDGTYWSYKADHTIVLYARSSSQSWFFDYWFDANNLSYISGLWISWVPLAIFVVQALTLAFGCASFVTNRRIISSVPVCLSLTVLALMSYVGSRLSPNYVGGYQLGYYLVYPSVALFALAFVLRARMSENRTVSIMLFILGLFLIAIGIGLSTVTQVLTFFPFGTQTVYPYAGIGSVMLIVGLIVLVVAFIKMRSKKTVTFEVKIPKTEQI